ITPLVIPALVAFRAAVGWTARLDGEIANGLLGTSVRTPVQSPGPRGFWRSGLNVLSDGVFWRQQGYLLIRQTAGFVVAVAERALLAASLGALTLPIWYRWSTPELGSWHVDTLGRALLGVPIGIVGLVIALLLLRPLAAGYRLLVVGLLGDREVRLEQSSEERRLSLKLHAASYAAINLGLIVIWALTSRGYFWPQWTIIVLGLPLAVHAWFVLVTERPQVARRQRISSSLAQREGIWLSLSLFFVLVWAVTGHGYFWPVWPILGF